MIKEFVTSVFAVTLGLFALAAIVATVFLIGMVFWGLVFMGFDWLFPTVLQTTLPDGLNTYHPFTIGAIFGFFMVLIRTAVGTK
ncbi:MAG: hypothetical protein ACXW13_00030 [Burkholderiaceae bacterium]